NQYPPPATRIRTQKIGVAPVPTSQVNRRPRRHVPPRPTASESQATAITERELLSLLKVAATHGLPPFDFGSLQIAHAAAHKDRKDELPEWAWAEYQVIYDTHASVTKAPQLLHKHISIFEITQWRKVRKGNKINRSHFPVSGAIGSPISPPKPTADPTMPDPSPRNGVSDGISEQEAPPASIPETQTQAPPETAIEITHTSDTPVPTPFPSEEFDNDTNYMTGLVGKFPVPVHYLA
ncbi:hypothetical protein Q9L58_010441, partial [Maublancomyces gigas]